MRRLWLRLFPSRREVILRANGRVRYIRIGRFGQLARLTVLCLAIGWAGHITERYSRHAEIVAVRDARIAALTATNRAVRRDLAALRGVLDAQEEIGRAHV